MTPPKTIYLQCFDDEGRELDALRDEITWCLDRINPKDAVYILLAAKGAYCRCVRLVPWQENENYCSNCGLPRPPRRIFS